jgi:hypothetical protein
MKTALALIAGILLCCSATHAQISLTGQGGFRELLRIVGIEPESLESISAEEPTAADWEILTQIADRLGQQSDDDLQRWTFTDGNFQPELIGELFLRQGIINEIVTLRLPSEIADRSGLEQMYLCRGSTRTTERFTLLTPQIPKSWDLSSKQVQAVSFGGVLLGTGEVPLFFTSHFEWYPQSGLPSGQLLLARHGMDASLWDDIVQRSPLVSPEKGREAEAFYAVLSTLAKVPAVELKRATDQAIAQAVSDSASPTTKLERQIAAAAEEQASHGLSSVVPLFLEPENSVGKLVRVEGVARRAVRVADGDPSREYYELEVFTSDSQNLPLVFAVKSLPPDFPLGDAIHAGVRLDGVFFKSWQYRTRKVVATNGATGTQQQRYTPLLMAARLTWLQEASTTPSWWGLAVGSVIFLVMISGLLRMIISFKRERRGTLSDSPPDFSGLG